jgi:putative tricarboxylic transport membrane protein
VRVDILASFASGLATAITPENLFFLLIGVLAGNLVGVLPGLGPTTGTVLLIPLTFGMAPTTAIIMLSGVYYGAMYGGSTTSILLNVPGESSSVMTAVEGHKLARQGRAGAALSMSAISSFVAGTAAVIGLMFLTPPMAKLALSFGPPEEFALLFAAFTIVASLGGGSMSKGLAMAGLGVVLATIGLEPVAAQQRMTFGLPPLEQGISFIAASIGLFALPEVMEAMERPGRMIYKRVTTKINSLLPTRQDMKESATAFPMGATVGFFGGIMPGAGATISAFLAYDIQKRISRQPEKFGKGSIEAVAAVEGANNAASTGAMIPMLSFGIPGSGTTAVIMGAMMIHGLRPGPMLFETNPDFVWALVASMYLGNIMLLILNLPLIWIWISCLRIPGHIVLTAVLALSVTGVYAEDNSLDNVIVMFAFGILGYALKKLRFPPAPIVLALILTGPLEGALARSLAMSGNDWTIFVSRPLATTLIVVAFCSIFFQIPVVRGAIGRVLRSGRS